MAEVGPTRLFAARGDRAEIGSFCALFEEDGIAQIDEVTTVEQYRRRGLARAVVVGALRASLEADAELVFLVADEADWPMRWYERRRRSASMASTCLPRTWRLRDEAG